MSKFLVIACLVAVACATPDKTKHVKTDPSKKAPKKTKATFSLVQSKHSDKWCHEHHLGSGAGSCVKHIGCCFSKKAQDMFTEDNKLELGPCHSCDMHSTKWCTIYGAASTKACIALSGCTWSVKAKAGKKCVSATSDADYKKAMTAALHKCADQAKPNNADYKRWKGCVTPLKNKCLKLRKGSTQQPARPYSISKLDKKGRCPEGTIAQWRLPTKKKGQKSADSRGEIKFGCRSLYSYVPKCDSKNTARFAPEQKDMDGIGWDGYFCVDAHGHEIADTRKTTGPLKKHDINCNTARDKNNGKQCPNAVTLTTKGGVVVVNKDRNKKDCAVHCNSDSDCNGGRWCCFNGCGYKCKTPVKPLSGCQQPPNAGHDTWALKQESKKMQKYNHNVGVKLGCKAGYDILPTSAPQYIDLVCKHGSWQRCVRGKPCTKKFSVSCKKSCKAFAIAGKQDARFFASSGRSAKDYYDSIKPVRARDFKIAGKGTHHGSSRTVTCQKGYGAVQHAKFLKGQFKHAESLSIVRHGKQVIKCTNGKWSARKIECSLCYDKYPHEWRDKAGNSCAFYKSRPMKCHTKAGKGALANCRVSCRSCAAAEAKYLQRERIRNLAGKTDAQKKKWKKKTRVLNLTRTKYKKVKKTVWVMKSYPVTEVCKCPKGNVHKKGKNCPKGCRKMA
jgi:hypothetical protein